MHFGIFISIQSEQVSSLCPKTIPGLLLVENGLSMILAGEFWAAARTAAPQVYRSGMPAPS